MPVEPASHGIPISGSHAIPAPKSLRKDADSRPGYPQDSPRQLIHNPLILFLVFGSYETVSKPHAVDIRTAQELRTLVEQGTSVTQTRPVPWSRPLNRLPRTLKCRFVEMFSVCYPLVVEQLYDVPKCIPCIKNL